ncbi:MAG: hypothetical protein M3Q95_08865 [Bacteroidota bacterium]|nr:hypothetical protein [Bacteroidota bacterium]
MKSMQLLIIIFLISGGMVMAGNGMPAKKLSDHICNAVKSDNSFYFNRQEELPNEKISESLTEERYYMKYRLNILKRPLYA